MSKEMFITVGTSLFSSASWEMRGRVKELVEEKTGLDYEEEWLRGEALTSPEKRLTSPSGAHTVTLLKDRLKAHNAEEWSGYLPQELLDGDPPATTAMRYSAELATLVKMAVEEGMTLRELLRSYAAIRLVAEEEAEPWAPAKHLACYLNRIADRQKEELARVWAIPGLSSTDPERLLGSQDQGLPRLLMDVYRRCRESDVAQVDLVIAGGYKIYGAVLSQLLPLLENEEPRLIYIFERGDKLMIFQRGFVKVDGRDYPLLLKLGDRR